MSTTIEKQSDLYNEINKYSKQFDIGFQLAEHIRFPSGVNKIVIATYGIPAATSQVVLDMFLKELENKKVIISSNYELPKNIDNNTLVIGIDLENDHPAVLSSLKSAYEQKANIVGVVTGGKTEQYIRERKLGLVLVDKQLKCLDQQIHTGLLIGIIIQILIGSRFLTIKSKFTILALAEKIENLYLTKLGEKLSDQIEDSTVLLYSEPDLTGLMQLFKSHLNIVLNIPVFYNTLPKAFGDELIGFSQKNFVKYKALFLMDKESKPKYKKDFEIAGKLLDQSKVKHRVWELPGENRQLSILTGIILLYWATYWLQEKTK